MQTLHRLEDQTFTRPSADRQATLPATLLPSIVGNIWYPNPSATLCRDLMKTLIGLALDIPRAYISTMRQPFTSFARLIWTHPFSSTVTGGSSDFLFFVQLFHPAFDAADSITHGSSMCQSHVRCLSQHRNPLSFRLRDNSVTKHYMVEHLLALCMSKFSLTCCRPTNMCMFSKVEVLGKDLSVFISTDSYWCCFE